MLEQKNRSRAKVRLAVFFVLSIHVLGLMALLMQGCRKPPEPEPTPMETNAVTAPETTPATMPDTNQPMATAPMDTAPPVAPMPVEPAAPQAQEYVVAKGDSFYTIAKKFNVTTKAVQDANPGVDPKKLQIGQKLQIPAPMASGSPAAPGGLTAAVSEGNVYTVKSGDTLTKIAADHGTTVKAIRSENNLITDKIKVGQKLKIPTGAPAPMPPPVQETAPAAPAGQ